MPAVRETVESVRAIDVDQYKYGFVTDIEMEKSPKGLSEDTVRFISAKKNEPQWMLDWRLEAYRRWLTMQEPTWARVKYGPIDYQAIRYYSAPKQKKTLNSLDEVDPERRERLPHRRQVAGAVVDQSDHSRPLVLGSIFASRASRAQATRNARANALNTASMW